MALYRFKVKSQPQNGEPQIFKPKLRLSKPELLSQDHPLLGNNETVLKYVFSQGDQFDTSALSYHRLFIVTNYVAEACGSVTIHIF